VARAGDVARREAAALRREVEEAAVLLGYRPREVATLTPRQPSKRGRSAHRVELEDGGRCKARVLESAAAVRALLRARAGLEAAFVPALAGHGRVLLEAWVDGEPLSEPAAEARAGEAGALLGRLHAATPASAPPSVSTAHRRRRAEADVAILERAALLSRAEAAALRGALQELDPGIAPTALVHLDFCPENMLLDAAGRLRVFDNELIRVGPAGLDLGRSLHRWPMAAAHRNAFLDAYRAAAPRDSGPIGFWVLVSVLWSARVRLDQPAERQAVALGAVRRWAADPTAMLETP
jgi:Ser/Thr protein kinase RdoA (MazF antagonist)